MKIKALALVSGGLDSLLAAMLVKEQGLEVIGLHFKIPFCKLDINKTLSETGIKTIEVDLGAEFIKLIQGPRYGFGSNMNPCIDCKILMLAKARQLLVSLGASFVVTGEVLGQRPMSQNRQTLSLIKRASGLDDLLLRPLSARLFAPTLPEREGWVDREKLFDFSGRLRRPQMQLAQKLGLSRYSNPAGGCLLTDPCFSRRLKELIGHGELGLDNLELLKIGRHFRVGENTRLVVGRNEHENSLLGRLVAPADHLFSPPEDMAGPVALARGPLGEELAALCCRITCAYSDTEGMGEMDIFCGHPGAEEGKACRTPCVHKNNFTHLLI